MVAALLACGVRRSAFGGATEEEPTARTADQTPHATRHTPKTERCPACGAERPRVELVHKGTRLNCCAMCYWARRHAARVRWEEANRARRLRQKREGGRPCPAYEAWDVEAVRRREDELGTCVVYGPRGRAWPEALVTFGPLIASTPPASRLVGACSCGEAGCVHLVVACLAQQGGESDE